MVLRAFSWICSQRSLLVDLGNDMGSLCHMQSKFPTYYPSFLASFFFLGFTFWLHRHTQCLFLALHSWIILLMLRGLHVTGTWVDCMQSVLLVCLSGLSLHFQSFLLFYAPS